jgi:hypothetical protein
MAIQVKFSGNKSGERNHLIRQQCLGKVSEYNSVNEKDPVNEVLVHREEDEDGKALWLAFRPGNKVSIPVKKANPGDLMLAEDVKTGTCKTIVFCALDRKFYCEKYQEVNIRSFRVIGNYLFNMQE